MSALLRFTTKFPAIFKAASAAPPHRYGGASTAVVRPPLGIMRALVVTLFCVVQCLSEPPPLAADPKLCRRLAKAGRETVVHEFNIHRSAEQMAALFTHL